MGTFKVDKRQSNSNDGYTETLKYYVMHQANVSTNHNKFYCIELQKHPDGRYRIFTHYGRLGISNIFEARENIDGKPCYDQGIAEKEFESIHKKKLSGKTVTDPDTGEKMKEAYVDVDVVSPQVGSENIRGKAEVKKQTTVKLAVDTSSYDPQVGKLLDQLIEENVHSITSMTSIKLTANGYATELGPVTPDHVDKAKKVLDDLNSFMKKDGTLDETSKDVQKLNSLFFSLIPKPFSRKISASDMILGAQKLQDEYDILDQLATGVQMGAAMNQNTAAKINALGTDIEVLKDKKEYDRIVRYIESSKADNHRGSNVWGYKVKMIYKIRIPEERSRYENVVKKYGNIEEVFHGSANSNLLSILKSGLIIPKSNAPHVCGRMHGDGVYGANNSTKSLNYSIGFWGGRRSSYTNNFLFLADFAMGKTYKTQNTNPNGAPHGYDSVWAQKGRNLYNDELIVYTLPQCTLKYLVEMVK
jgi:poly [ADP-ribose] polymerase 2/3/4